MFNSKNDPLVDSVKKIIQENDVRHRVETELNEHLGIASRKALPHELQAEYDSVLAEAINKALNEGVEGSIPKTPEERKLAAKYGNPKRITHGDVLTGRGVIEEAPIYNVIHPEHGVIGTHSYDRGFVPSKPSLGFKAGKTIPDGAKIDRQNMIKSKTKNNMMKEETQLDEAGRTLMPRPSRTGSIRTAINKSEERLRVALNKAARMVNKGFSPEEAARNRDVPVDALKKHMMKKEAEQIDETSFSDVMRSYTDLGKKKAETEIEALKNKGLKPYNLGMPKPIMPNINNYKEETQKATNEENDEGRESVGASRRGRDVQAKFGGGGSDPQKGPKKQPKLTQDIKRIVKKKQIDEVESGFTGLPDKMKLLNTLAKLGYGNSSAIPGNKYNNLLQARVGSALGVKPGDIAGQGIANALNLKEEQPYGDEEHHFYVDEKGRYELADKKPRHPEKSRFTTMAKAEARNRRIDSGDSGVKAELNEKAVSKAQHRLMGAAYAAKKSGEAVSPEVAKVARSMTMKQLKDYAKTKEKGLPEKVGK